jgi:hypothetical protein
MNLELNDTTGGKRSKLSLAFAGDFTGRATSRSFDTRRIGRSPVIPTRSASPTLSGSELRRIVSEMIG